MANEEGEEAEPDKFWPKGHAATFRRLQKQLFSLASNKKELEWEIKRGKKNFWANSYLPSFEASITLIS